MSFVYNGAHSITFIEALDSTTNSTPTAYSSYKRSWRDFHLIPEKRPSVSPPTPTLNLIDVPGTNKRIDMTDLLPGGLKYGRRTGEWQFILDHYLWDNWHTAKKTIEDALNGKRLYCVLEDDFNTAYRGRFKVTGWQSGPDYSSIAISYELEPKNYINAFSIQSDEQEHKMLSSWNEVDKMIQDGSYKKNISIGDSCYLYIPGEYNNYVEVAALDSDKIQYNSSQTIPITWIAKKLLDNKAPMYLDGYHSVEQVANWYKSTLRDYLNEDHDTNRFKWTCIYNRLPGIVKKMIKGPYGTYKYTLAYTRNHEGDTTETPQLYENTSYNYLWIPSYREVFGSGQETSGPIYSNYFSTAQSRCRNNDNTGVDCWHLRTPYPNLYKSFAVINSEGNIIHRSPEALNNEEGVLIGFCTGASNVG